VIDDADEGQRSDQKGEVNIARACSSPNVQSASVEFATGSAALLFAVPAAIVDA